MIVISDCSKDIVIPAGLGDNAGVVYEKSGVESLNGQQGDLTLKTVNGNELLGEGDVAIDTGVESLNGQKGALTLKTVNGNELTGEGDIEIKGGVETLNGETGDVKIKTVNGQSLMGEGDVPVDVGVETLNGQKGNLKIKSVNGAEMLGEGNVAIDTGVESLNGQKGALTLKTVNGNDMLGDGNIEIKAGVESVNGETGNVIVKSLKYFDLAPDNSYEAYEEIANHWDNQKGYTGDFIFRYKKGKSDFTFDEIGYLKDQSVFFSYLNNSDAYDIGNCKVRCLSMIIWKDGYTMDINQQACTIPTKTSQLTNDSNYQTKIEVDTAIENAVSGAGSDSVIVLDGLTQAEVKAIYDKLDKTKVPDAVFIYHNSSTFRTYWDGDVLHLQFFENEYNGISVTDHPLRADGSIGYSYPVYKYNNSLTLNVQTQINDGADFECDYSGNFFEYMGRDTTRPNSYYILFSNGIGDSTKPVFAPVSVIWDNNNFDGHSPIRIQFTANEKLYTYLHDSSQENKWLFESAKPIGGVQSSEVSNIKVLTQAEYDALTTKDENVLYCIKG